MPPPTSITTARIPAISPDRGGTPFKSPTRRRKKKGTIKDLKTNLKRSRNDKLAIQERAIQAMCDYMGPDFWLCTEGSGRSYKDRHGLIKEVWKKSGFMFSYRTLMRLTYYYQQYGEVPARAQKHNRYSSRDKRSVHKFNHDDKKVLEQIIALHPQLHLDEIQDELLKATGKTWKPSTIWKQLTSMNYSLKFAVFRAKQQQQAEVDACFLRLLDRLKHPRQLIYVDESVLSQPQGNLECRSMTSRFWD